MAELHPDIQDVVARIRTRMAGGLISADDAYVIVLPSDTGERAVAMLVVKMSDGETPLQAAEALLHSLGLDDPADKSKLC